MALRSVLQHRIAPIGGDDGQARAHASIDALAVRLHHGAGVESRDLVVVTVGHDHRLGGIGVLRQPDMAGADAQVLQALQVVAAIVAQHGHGQGLTAQQLEAVGDVARASTKIAAQLRHQERDVQDVQLVGQDLLGKAPLEGHDGVERQGSANQRCHFLCVQ